MNNRKEIKNKYNLIIGWIDEREGGISTATHIKKGYVGRYVKSSNLTLDKSGRIYCYGDGLSDLIREADRS